MPQRLVVVFRVRTAVVLAFWKVHWTTSCYTHTMENTIFIKKIHKWPQATLACGYRHEFAAYFCSFLHPPTNQHWQVVTVGRSNSTYLPSQDMYSLCVLLVHGVV